MMARLFFLILFGLAGMIRAAEWTDSYQSAKKQAIRQDKKILIFFSGSDWCEDGRILSRDLFHTREFQILAAKKYVLYNADFPKYTRLGQEKEDRNKRLAARYGIHRFPAVVVVEPKFGSMLVKHVGMTRATPKQLLDKLSQIEKETARPYSQPKKPAAGKTAP
ncbi:MAG: thioredoxin family protein [Lentisphaeria bacterium]|nr:thioredoxin family protein [Lentisphaeria bacterium]